LIETTTLLPPWQIIGGSGTEMPQDLGGCIALAVVAHQCPATFKDITPGATRTRDGVLFVNELNEEISTADIH